MKGFSIYALFGLFIIIFSCGDNPTEVDDSNGDSNEIGKIFFQIDMASAPSQVVDLRGILFRDGYDSIPFNFFYDDTSNSASVNIENVPTGTWDLQVDALNIDSVVVYSGSTSVLINAGTTTNVNLYLNPIAGSIVINVHWGNGKTITDLDDYLIGYWNFEENEVHDLSSFSNSGAIFGNTSFTEGKKGNAINFEGYDCYAVIPNIPAYSSDQKTISFWMYKNNDSILETENKNDGEGIVAKAYDSGLKRDFSFAISGNRERFHIYGTIGTEGDTLLVSGKTQAISEQTWYHCTLVVGKNFTEFYLNGTLTEYNNKSYPSINTSAPILLGKLSTSALPTRYFNGKIDELRIYNKALTNSEIQLLYYDAL